MKSNDDVSNLRLSKAFKFANISNPEYAIATLIEAAELLRRNKIVTVDSYTEVFFSAAKQYLV